MSASSESGNRSWSLSLLFEADMISFEEYFSDERILHYVCKCRATLAKRRNRRQLVYNVSGNSAALRQGRVSEDETLLQSILPPRRQWKKLNAKARTRSDGQPLNSLDKNVRILKHTVQWFQQKKEDAPFVEKLERFCNNVRALVTAAKPAIPSPEIIPSLKKPGDTQCRPIAAYPLAAKIAICITNKYLSERFDGYFEDVFIRVSYAQDRRRLRTPDYSSRCLQSNRKYETQTKEMQFLGSRVRHPKVL